MRTSVKMILGVVLSAAISSVAIAETVTVGSGAAAVENIYRFIEAPFEQASGIDLVIEPNGPVEGTKKFEAGALDAVTSGVNYADMKTMLAKDNHVMADESNYKIEVIGKDVIKVFLDKSLNIKALSKEQIKNIFTGKVTNWRDVGGPDIDISVIYAKQNEGTNAAFKAAMLDGEEYLAERLNVVNTIEIKQMIAETEGGVAIGPRSMGTDNLVAPEIPEIGRSIYFFTKKDCKPAVQKLIDFLKGDGQALMK